MGQGQRLRSDFLCAAVDIRGSALASHYQSKELVCVSVIRGRMIVWMWSTDF